MRPTRPEGRPPPASLKGTFSLTIHRRPDCQRSSSPPTRRDRPEHFPVGRAPAVRLETAFVSSRRPRSEAVSVATRVILPTSSAMSKGHPEKIAGMFFSPSPTPHRPVVGTIEPGYEIGRTPAMREPDDPRGEDPRPGAKRTRRPPFVHPGSPSCGIPGSGPPPTALRADRTRRLAPGEPEVVCADRTQESTFRSPLCDSVRDVVGCPRPRTARHRVFKEHGTLS